MDGKNKGFVAFRIPDDLVDRMDKEIENSETFHNRSQLLKSALIHYLNHLENERTRGGGVNKLRKNQITQLKKSMFAATQLKKGWFSSLLFKIKSFVVPLAFQSIDF